MKKLLLLCCLLGWINAQQLIGQNRAKTYAIGFGLPYIDVLTLYLKHDYNFYCQYSEQIKKSSFFWEFRGDFGVYEEIQVGGNERPVHFSFQKDRAFALGNQVKHDNLSAGVKQFGTFDAITLFFKVSPAISFQRNWSKRLRAGVAVGQSFWYYKLQGLGNSDFLAVNDPRYAPTELELLVSPTYKRGLDMSQSIRPELSYRFFGNASIVCSAVLEHNLFQDETHGLWAFMGFKFNL